MPPVVVEPDELGVEGVGVVVGGAHLTGAGALERDPLGDVAVLALPA